MPCSVLEKALTAISRYNMLPAGTRVVAAVSGGADSVCLFHVLRELAPRLCFTVAGIAHLNHTLRGEESDGDEHFVAALAERWGVRFFGESADVAAAGGNLEQSARRARQAFFAKVLREGGGDRIATGHTRDDQAETVLFRVLRGAGSAGLAGILPVTREGLVRPLLEVSREEVEGFLRDRGEEWREDASNRDEGFARNRIRHTLMPELAREWNPEVRAALARLGDTASEEERWWRGKIERLAAKVAVEDSGGVEVDARAVAGLPQAVGRRLVRYLVGRSVETSLDAAGTSARATGFDAVERVIELAAGKKGEGSLDLGAVRVVRSFDRVRFMTAGGPVTPGAMDVKVPGRYEWEGSLVCLDSGVKPVSGGCARLKLSGVASAAPLTLRGWRAGDHYHPAGHFRDQKLKEMFQQARIPSWRRVSWPILCQGAEILWARQFGAAAKWVAGESDPGFFIWDEPVEEKLPKV
ncbi:MAG TPA: tRNA lysidine(34) synthetase TilS [Bryobacteraceae bacterium]